LSLGSAKWQTNNFLIRETITKVRVDRVEGVGVQGVLQSPRTSVGRYNLHVFLAGDDVGQAGIRGPIPVGNTESQGGADVLRFVSSRVGVGDVVDDFVEHLLIQGKVGTMPG
jgi:hypothetical protein